MGQGALSKPAVQWWLSLNSSTQLRFVMIRRGLKVFVLILPPCFGNFG